MPGLVALWRRHLLFEYCRSTMNEAVARVAVYLLDNTTSGTAHAVALEFGKQLKVDYSRCRPDGRSDAFHYLESMASRYRFVHRHTTVTGTVDRQSVVHYRVDLAHFTHQLQHQLLLSIVTRRYGTPSARLLRHLHKHGPLEDRTLSERLLMTAKEVRERLYQLLATGLVHLQEVPKGVNREPAKTVYLWSGRAELVGERLRQRQVAALVECICCDDSTGGSTEAAMARRLAIVLDHFIMMQ
jgi:hypothetical protein